MKLNTYTIIIKYIYLFVVITQYVPYPNKSY